MPRDDCGNGAAFRAPLMTFPRHCATHRAKEAPIPGPMAPRPGVQRDEAARLLVVAAGGPAAAHVARQQREREGAGEVGEHQRGAQRVDEDG